MKLRNRKTGEVRTFEAVNLLTRAEYDDGLESYADYSSLAGLNEEWEDYKPAEPLIKDEQIRKAIRAWAEANSILGDEKVEVSTPTIDCCVLGLLYGFTSIDLAIDEEVTFKNHGRYTIDELCGEE